MRVMSFNKKRVTDRRRKRPCYKARKSIFEKLKNDRRHVAERQNFRENDDNEMTDDDDMVNDGDKNKRERQKKR